MASSVTEGADALPSGLRRAAAAIEETIEGAGAYSEHRRSRVVFLNAPRGSGRTTVLDLLRQRYGDQVRDAVGESWASSIPFSLVEQLVRGTELANELGSTNAKGVQGEELVHLSRNLHRWIRERCTSGRMVLLLDDIHYSDFASLQVLTHLGRRMAAEPLTLVFSSAAEEFHRLDSDTSRFLEDPRHCQVTISPLESQEILDIARKLNITGIEHYGAAALRRHTGGLLRTVVETLRELPGGQWPSDPTWLPIPSVQARHILEDFEHLTQEAQGLAKALAVIDTPVDLGILGKVAGLKDPELALDHCVEAGMLREEIRSGRKRLRFTRWVARAVLRDSMLPSERRQLHHAAAQHAEDVGSRLLHQAAATQTSDSVLADALTTAAETAGQAGRWHEAAEFHFAAAQVMGSAGKREYALLQGVDALASAGMIVEAMPWLQVVEAVPPSPVRDTVLANVALHRGRAVEVDDLLSRAESSADAEDAAHQKQIALRRTLDALVRWDGQKLVEWADRAMELSQPQQPSYVESQAMRGVGLAALGLTESADADILDASFGQSGGAQSQRFHLSAGWVAMLDDKLRVAVRELEAAVPTRYRGGSLRISLWAQAWLARAQYVLGEWDAALRTAEQGLARAEESGITLIAPLLHWTSSEIKVWRGQSSPPAYWPEAGMIHMHGYLAMQVPARLARAVAARARGDHDSRATILSPLLDADPWTEERVPFWLWQPELLDALTAGDRLNEAQSLANELSETSSSAPPHHRAQVLAGQGKLAAAQGQHDQADTCFQEALKLLTRIHRPTTQAQVMLAYGQFLRRAGRRRDAADQLKRAKEFYESVCATVLAEQCAQELRATGMSTLRGDDELPKSSHSSSGRPQFTPQEESVAGLVVQGLTNAETAKRLFIAEKTVQYHLTRIYAKLGIRSRTELASVYKPAEYEEPSQY